MKILVKSREKLCAIIRSSKHRRIIIFGGDHDSPKVNHFEEIEPIIISDVMQLLKKWPDKELPYLFVFCNTFANSEFYERTNWVVYSDNPPDFIIKNAKRVIASPT